jgi:predicted CXXCH cytochrome family protein
MPHRFVGLLLAACVFADEPRILRPVDQSVVAPGPLSIVARGSAKSELRLDGKQLAATQPGPSALTAVAKLSPGLHELVLRDGGSEQKIQFLVQGAPGAPAAWSPFRAHPPAATCDACHAVKEGAWEFKSGSCFACHDAKPFPSTHSHTTEVLAECQLCHSPHGSTAVKHLKMKKELACKQCHG